MGVACSQTLNFLFKVRQLHVIKNKNCRGFIDHQHKGRALLPRLPIFLKRTQRKVYWLMWSFKGQKALAAILCFA